MNSNYATAKASGPSHMVGSVDPSEIKTMERLETLMQEIEGTSKTVAELHERLGPFLLPCGPDGGDRIESQFQGSQFNIGLQEATSRLMKTRIILNEIISRIR